MDIKRSFWLNKVKESWSQRPIVWLAGVRRSGKTTLAQSISNSTYINCDLPSQQRLLEDPEDFYKNLKTNIVIFDEIHQLSEATMLLKIGADHFKEKKILATGSSTLIASKKFKDTLTGRKQNLHFLPVLVDELTDFKSTLKKRILHGGLPPSLLRTDVDDDFFSEWMDSFYARDIQELYIVEKKQAFLKVLEYLLIANGHQFEVTKLAQASGVTRPTIIKYLDILENTKAISLIKPFSNNPLQEIISQPKVYGFDTGFSCFAKGIKDPRNEDYGQYLENLVLETFQSQGYGEKIRYWRNKQQHEIDFILPIHRNNILAIECKWQEKNFEEDNLNIFRKSYNQGENWVVTADSRTRLVKTKKYNLHYINIFDLPSMLEKLR